MVEVPAVTVENESVVTVELTVVGMVVVYVVVAPEITVVIDCVVRVLLTVVGIVAV
jgi:hypothetical protein